MTPRMGALATGDSPWVEARLAERLELVVELLLPVVPPLGPSVERHTRKNKINCFQFLSPRVNFLNFIFSTEMLINMLNINARD